MAVGDFGSPNPSRPDDIQTDTWLASRYPMSMADACGFWNPTTSYTVGQWVRSATNGNFYVCIQNVAASSPGKSPETDAANWQDDPISDKNPNGPCWPAVTAPLLAGMPAVDLSTGLTIGGGVRLFDGNTSRYLVQPTFLSGTNGATYPALRTFDPFTKTFQTYLAASASGNGIPDAWMWPAYPGTLNGVNYYAAVRIIDNNSAINVNTANAVVSDFNYDGSLLRNYGLFPSNIGVAELLATYPNAPISHDYDLGQEYVNLNAYRVLADRSNTTAPTGIPRPSGILNSSNSPINDNNFARADFQYISVADALFTGVGRRVSSPGYAVAGQPYSTFSWGDAGALDYRFDLVNPASLSGSLSTIETLLQPSLLTNPA
jgi:hypothetical protein